MFDKTGIGKKILEKNWAEYFILHERSLQPRKGIVFKWVNGRDTKLCLDLFTVRLL